MPTILLKKSDTPGSVPGTANLTNLAGGVEVAVNTADKRVYSMTSASAVIELGTNPSSLTCSDVSATVLRAGSATITNLLGTTLTISGNSFLATSSGNVGVGTTSPTEKLTVAGNIKLGTSGTSYLYGPATNGRSFIANSDATAYMGIYGSAYGSGLDSIISFVAGTTNTMTFNASGNLGLGVTPSAWGSIFKAVQVGTGGSIFGRASGNQDVCQVGANVFWDGSNWKYIASLAATRYEQASGTHVWSYAGSGTAGNTITFTEAMTLDASGNLGIGTTSPASRLNISTGEVTLVTYTSSRASGSYNTYNLGTSGTTLGYIGHAPQLVVGTSNNEFAIRAESALIFAAGGNTERARITSGGNLLVGTTSELGTNSVNTNSTGATVNGFYSLVSGFAAAFVGVNNTASTVRGVTANTVGFGTADSVALTFGTSNLERARITSGGLFGLGTASPASAGGVALVVHDSSTPRIRLTNSTTGEASTDGAEFNISGSDLIIENRENAPTRFFNNGAERARITSGGDMVVGSTTASGRFLSSSGENNKILTGFSTAASGYTDAIVVSEFRSYSPNNTSARFLYCGDNADVRAEIRSNGGLANYQANNTNLSDERTKKDIAPLGSMWAKFKAIEIVTFKYKDQTHEDNNIGVIAQQVEAVAPEFVDADGWGETPEDGVPLKSVYTADMYHAAIKALQEAMARIESLEADVAALKGAK